MTNIKLTPSEPVLAAIDISKNRHEVLIEIPGKKRRRVVSQSLRSVHLDFVLNLQPDK
jgi:hypothetical protein